MKQEVEAVAQCRRANIMTVFSPHFDNEKIPFVVCEHLGDVSLQTLVSAYSPLLSPHNLLIVAEHLLQALSHMHSKNWIHRDVKPGNVMWSHTVTDTFKVVLIDCGIAKSLSEQ